MNGDLVMRLPGTWEGLTRAMDAATSFLRARGAEERTLYAALIVVEEVVSNLVRHAFAADGEAHEIQFSVSREGDAVRLRFVDHAAAFDPRSAPRPDLDGPLEQRRAGQLGMHLLDHFSRRIDYRSGDGRNELTIWI